MGKHSGSEGAQPAARDRRRLLLLALGLTLTLIAWGLLVWLAIDFGTEARGGSTPAWIFLLVATLGATACLFLGLQVGTKLVAVLRGDDSVPAPRPSGGKRAAR